jgi:hypothetical protein
MMRSRPLVPRILALLLAALLAGSCAKKTAHPAAPSPQAPPKITPDLKNVSAAEALRWLSAKANLFFITSDDAIGRRIVTFQSATPLTPEEAVCRLADVLFAAGICLSLGPRFEHPGAEPRQFYQVRWIGDHCAPASCPSPSVAPPASPGRH